MKLLELVKHDNIKWPDGATYIVQDASGVAWFSKNIEQRPPHRHDDNWGTWMCEPSRIKLSEVAEDNATAIVMREDVFGPAEPQDDWLAGES